ncbi:MAG: PepSY domain-containing protein [Pseudobacteriovorax sp.]|nr:PepSY domain-containing protein [Pseudobacteriovorax sp.]
MKFSAFRVHSKLALIAFLPLIVICVTGSILVFKIEIDQFLMPEKYSIQETPGSRITLDEMSARAQSKFPDFLLASWEVFDDGERPDSMYLIKKKTAEWYRLQVNPYSGEFLGTPTLLSSDLTDWLLELHYQLLLHGAGIVITLIVGILLCILGVTGIILHRRFWKNLFTLRLNKRLAVAFSDLHKMVGIFASPVLLVVGMTGVYFNIEMIVHDIFEHSHDHEAHVFDQPMHSQDLSLDTIVNSGSEHIDGFETTYFVLPYEPDMSITLYGKVPDVGLFTSNYASGINFNPETGAFKDKWDIREMSFLSLLTDSFRRLHFGNFGGLISKILWSLVGITPLVLSISGIYLWFTRRQARQKRLRKKQKSQRLAFDTN